MARVSVVDDDISMRESLPELLRELGFEANAFPSAEAFLASAGIERNDCLILDVNLPGMSGPELKNELDRRSYNVPVIFITAHSETATSLAPRLGAKACLIKPFADTQLLDALNKAMSQT